MCVRESGRENERRERTEKRKQEHQEHGTHTGARLVNKAKLAKLCPRLLLGVMSCASSLGSGGKVSQVNNQKMDSQCPVWRATFENDMNETVNTCFDPRGPAGVPREKALPASCFPSAVKSQFSIVAKVSNGCIDLTRLTFSFRIINIPHINAVCQYALNVISILGQHSSDLTAWYTHKSIPCKQMVHKTK